MNFKNTIINTTNTIQPTKHIITSLRKPPNLRMKLPPTDRQRSDGITPPTTYKTKLRLYIIQEYISTISSKPFMNSTTTLNANQTCTEYSKIAGVVPPKNTYFDTPSPAPSYIA